MDSFGHRIDASFLDTMTTVLKIFSIAFLVISTGLMLSCNVQQNEFSNQNDPIITLDFTREYDSVEAQLEDVADHIEVIHMETTSESLLRSIRGVFSENYILCLSGVRALLFDRNGNFLGKMGGKGKGPDEYWDSNRWAIDEENNLIYSYNPYNSKMIRYNLVSREVESTFITETNGSLQDMIVLSKDSIFAIRHVNRMFPYQYYYLSTDGEFLDGKAWDTTSYFHSGTYSTPFLHQDQNNRIILQSSNNDTIFEIRGIDAYPIVTFKPA